MIGSFLHDLFSKLCLLCFFYALDIFYVTLIFITCLCHNNEERLKTPPNLTCLLIICVDLCKQNHQSTCEHVRIKDIIWRVTGLFFADIMNHFDTHSLNLFDFVFIFIYLSFFTTSLTFRWNIILKLQHHENIASLYIVAMFC